MNRLETAIHSLAGKANWTPEQVGVMLNNGTLEIYADASDAEKQSIIGLIENIIEAYNERQEIQNVELDAHDG